MIYALSLSLLPVLWVFFLAYSALKPRWALLRPEVKAVGAVVVFIGLVIDITFNWTFGLLLGFTPDLTFSQKCGRLKYEVTGWRRAVAWYCCTNWLDPFENGGHCRG